MKTKRNVVLYLDAELVKKTREFGFNLSKTVENHLKHLVKSFQSGYSQKMCGKIGLGSPGEIRTLVSGSRAQEVKDSFAIADIDGTVADFREYLRLKRDYQRRLRRITRMLPSVS